MLEAIQSIKYDKQTSEYRIVRRNLQTGKTSTTFANHLTDQEKLWARINCKTRYEDTQTIQWNVS